VGTQFRLDYVHSLIPGPSIQLQSGILNREAEPMQLFNRIREQIDVTLLTILTGGLLAIILWMIDAKLP
jgi:hypothetical protein